MKFIKKERDIKKLAAGDIIMYDGTPCLIIETAGQTFNIVFLDTYYVSVDLEFDTIEHLFNYIKSQDSGAYAIPSENLELREI